MQNLITFPNMYNITGVFIKREKQNLTINVICLANKTYILSITVVELYMM